MTKEDWWIAFLATVCVVLFIALFVRYVTVVEHAHCFSKPREFSCVR